MMTRRAGVGPRRLARMWRRRRLAAAASVVLAVVGLLWSDLPTQWSGSGVVAAVLVWKVSDRRVGRAIAGEAGERLVASRLGWRTAAVFGWRSPGARFDVDVVVFEPCVAAIEVKRGQGRLRVLGDGAVSAGGRPIPGRAVRQATRGAAALRSAAGLDQHVTAILCITHMVGRPRVVVDGENPVVVCSAKWVRRVLRRLEPSTPATRRLLRELVS